MAQVTKLGMGGQAGHRNVAIQEEPILERSGCHFLMAWGYTAPVGKKIEHMPAPPCWF